MPLSITATSGRPGAEAGALGGEPAGGAAETSMNGKATQERSRPNERNSEQDPDTRRR
jgi:hypothetical protein